MKNNPLALDVYLNNKFDLTDERINIESLKLDNIVIKKNNENLKQIDLGVITVLPTNSISLEDVDVYNVP
jgi:hypothetical protein